MSATRDDRALRTTVRLDHLRVDLTVGAVLPSGKSVSAVTLNGRPVAYDVVRTSRGDEVRVRANGRSNELVVRLR